MKDESPNGIVIEAEGLTKVYYRNRGFGHWLARAFGLKSSMRLDAVPSTAVYALRDVGFTVKKGEAFGIIGRNGAGKSTLLQVVAGTLQLNAGSLKIAGRVTALLELGSGFNPEFSGRENIYLAGSILGIGRQAMDSKCAEIEAFADIGHFIDQPVKTYSTGMVMRVAFAVAVAVQPDVLIIDEALSVGDILFQQKCNRRLRELLAGGVTLLVVTHDTSFVLNMCHRAMWLDKGKIRFLGDASQCVREYVTAMSAAAGNETCLSTSGAEMPEMRLPLATSQDLSACQRLGDGGVEIEKLWIQNEAGEACTVFKQGTWCRLSLLVHAHKKVRLVSGGCELRDRLGQVVFATGLRATRRLMESMEQDERRMVVMRFKVELKEAQYTLDVGVGAGESADNTWQRVLATAILEVSSTPDQDIVHGMVRLPYEVGAFRVV
jgi:ABC-type polysaccharide/polyol phosphate transport system ATPase subunit